MVPTQLEYEILLITFITFSILSEFSVDNLN